MLHRLFVLEYDNVSVVPLAEKFVPWVAHHLNCPPESIHTTLYLFAHQIPPAPVILIVQNPDFADLYFASVQKTAHLLPFLRQMPNDLMAKLG